MDNWSIWIFALLVMFSSAALLVWHRWIWRQIESSETDAAERDFRRRQYRRRMQTSAMLGLLGAAILVGFLGQSHAPPLAVVIYWGAVLVLVLWISLLAIVDVWATRFHFGKQRTAILLEQTKLRAELRQKLAPRNGKPPSEH